MLFPDGVCPAAESEQHPKVSRAYLLKRLLMRHTVLTLSCAVMCFAPGT